MNKPFANWTDADRAGLTPGVSDAVQAIHGVGLMAVNQNPYLYGNDVKLVYFDPTVRLPTSATLSYKAWSQPVTVTDGQPFDFAAAVRALPPEDTISSAGIENRLFLKVNGHARAVSLDVSEIAYSLSDLALSAIPKASSGRPENAIDAVAVSAPSNPDNEWVTKGNQGDAWIKLTWPKGIKAARVLLYDRPNPGDQVLAGKLTFSDGSSLEVGELPNDGRKPLEIIFPEKRITWLRFEITKTSPTTRNTGLAELGVFAH